MRAIIAVTVLVLSSLALWPQAANPQLPDFRSYVIVVNLYPNAVDFQIGDTASLRSLPPGTPSNLILSDSASHPYFYFRESGTEPWHYLEDDGGAILGLDIHPGTVLVVKIDSAGTVTTLTLTHDVQSANPRVAFLNADTQAVDDMLLMSDDFHAVAHAPALGPESFSSFVSLRPGLFGAELTLGSETAFLSGSVAGTVGLFAAKADAWYLLVHRSGVQDSLQFWDISPGILQ